MQSYEFRFTLISNAWESDTRDTLDNPYVHIEKLIKHLAIRVKMQVRFFRSDFAFVVDRCSIT